RHIASTVKGCLLRVEDIGCAAMADTIHTLHSQKLQKTSQCKHVPKCLMVEEANHLQNNLAAEKIRRGGDLRERAKREAAERETDRVRMTPEKALALGDDPEKVPDVAQVPKWRKKREEILYDCVDSLGVLETEEYSLITNFPRTVYGRDKESMSLKDAGLHPQASLFIEIH
ncbi:hypothetical protein HID58_067202, partial [Brassica napus]